MANASAEKIAVVKEVSEKLAKSNAAIITEYRGLSVGSLATLRRALRPHGAEYKVYKNTLARFAARESGYAELEQFLKGPAAITFVGKAISAKELKALADLPPREVMLAQLAGMLQAPLTKTANMFAALPRKTAYALKALVEQREAA
jgi:large subunit ribosomal protein L10